MTQEEKDMIINAGYDLNGALARFVNNEMLFLTFLKKFPQDEHYAEIYPNIEKKDYDEAYKAAHAIKGIAGNLGLTPVFDTVNELLAAIKNKDTIEDFDNKMVTLYNSFDEEFKKASDIISSIQ